MVPRNSLTKTKYLVHTRAAVLYIYTKTTVVPCVYQLVRCGKTDWPPSGIPYHTHTFLAMDTERLNTRVVISRTKRGPTACITCSPRAAGGDGRAGGRAGRSIHRTRKYSTSKHYTSDTNHPVLYDARWYSQFICSDVALPRARLGEETLYDKASHASVMKAIQKRYVNGKGPTSNRYETVTKPFYGGHSEAVETLKRSIDLSFSVPIYLSRPHQTRREEGG